MVRINWWKPAKTIFQRLIDQLKDPMVIILIAAAAVSGVVGEMADAAVILVVVILNSILGVVQEGKAEKAIEALARLSSPLRGSEGAAM